MSISLSPTLNTGALTPSPAWSPSPDVIDDARVTQFMRWLEQERGLSFVNYDALWQWSVDEIDAFWLALWEWAAIPSIQKPHVALAEATMPGATWFPGVQMNYVEQVFRHSAAGRPAIVDRNEAGEAGEMSWAELERQVAGLAASLRGMGVVRGDRVAAYLSNTPHAIVAFLAVASIGAIWSACAPDMGELAMLDRFRQIEPKVMIAVDGYRYGGKEFDRRLHSTRGRIGFRNALLSPPQPPCFVELP